MSISPVKYKNNFYSPLSKEGSSNRELQEAKRRKIETSVKKALFPEIKSDIDTLQSTYGIKLSSLENSFFIEQLKAFEELFTILSLNDQERQELRIYISGILNNSYAAFKEKNEELGALYYYLDRDGQVEFVESFLERRVEELCIEYNQLCKNFYTNNVLPSGKDQYLLRGFARMIISTRGVLNLSGVHSVLHMVKSTPLQLAFDEMHVLQIETILKAILRKPDFQALLSTELTVHPGMEDLIRLDLKVNKNFKIESPHIHYNFLIFLFTFVRQHKTSNCYAICYTKFLLTREPELLYKQLIEVYKTGTFTLPHVSLPVITLIKDQLVLEDLMDIEVDKSAKDLTFIEKTLREVPQINKEELPVSKIRDFLPFTDKDQIENTLFGRKILSSFFQNYCQIVHFTESQLFYTNDRKIFTTGAKVHLLNYLVIELQNALSKEIVSLLGTKVDDLFESLFNQLLDYLWLSQPLRINVREEELGLDIGYEPYIKNITFQNKKEKAQFLDIFEQPLWFYFLNGKNFYRLNSISQLSEILSLILNKQLSNENSKFLSMKILENYKNFDQFLSDCFYKYYSSFTNFPQTDSFLQQNQLQLPQVGGQVTSLGLKVNYNLQEVPLNCKYSLFIQDFLFELKELSKKNKAFSECKQDFFLLAQNEDHVFTIIPYLFKDYLTHVGDVQELINSEFIHAGELLIKKPLNKLQIQKIISFDPKIEIKDFEKESAIDLYHNIVKQIESERVEAFKRVFLTVFNQISFEELDIDSLLNELNVDLNDQNFIESLSIIEKDQLYFNLELAALLKTLLINSGHTSPPSTTEIEKILCRLTGKPKSFIFGDSNYLAFQNDTSHARYYCIRYNPIDNKFNFCLISNYSERILSDKDSKELVQNLSLLIPVDNFNFS